MSDQDREDSLTGQWDAILRPRRGPVVLDVENIWRYRDLAWMFFKRDFISLYKQTILGPIWYVIQPLLTALTYYIIFARIANIPTSSMPPFLFYMSAIVVWTFFSSCVTNNAEVFSKNAQLFGKVYFPRLVVPIAVMLSGSVAFAIQFCLLVVAGLGFMVAGSDVAFNLTIIPMVVPIILYVGFLGIAVGMIVSSLTVRYRDLAYATTFVVQLWMYASPVVYPYSQIPARYRWFFKLNPMTAPVESLRTFLFGVPGAPMDVWIANLTITAVLLICGLMLFSKAEATAMDTV